MSCIINETAVVLEKKLFHSIPVGLSQVSGYPPESAGKDSKKWVQVPKILPDSYQNLAILVP